MKETRQLINKNVLKIVYGLLAVAALYFLYVFRLSTLMPLASRSEIDSQRGSQLLHNIITNPINGPYKLLEYLALHFAAHDLFLFRLVGALVGVLICLLFYNIIRTWHGKNIAVLSTVLFASSAWALHVGRLANGDITFLLLPVLLIWLISFLKNTNRHNLALIVTLITFFEALYTPGGVWFLVLVSIVCWRYIVWHNKRSYAGLQILIGFVSLMILVPLAYAFYHDYHLINVWLGLPAHVPNLISTVKRWLDSAVYLAVFGPKNPEIWLGRLPILSVFTSAMTLIGLYFYVVHRKAQSQRLKILVSFAFVGSVLVALNGARFISLLVPLAYIVATTGIAYLLHQWYGVFPRNPLARKAGLTLLCLCIATVVVYSVNAYFVAWHANPDAIAAFRYHI